MSARQANALPFKPWLSRFSVTQSKKYICLTEMKVLHSNAYPYYVNAFGYLFFALFYFFFFNVSCEFLLVVHNSPFEKHHLENKSKKGNHFQMARFSNVPGVGMPELKIQYHVSEFMGLSITFRKCPENPPFP